MMAALAGVPSHPRADLLAADGRRQDVHQRPQADLHQDGTRTERDLPTDDAVLAAYRDHFGIVLDHVPTAAAGVAWLGSGGRGRARPVLHLLHGLLQGPVDVLRVDAEFLGGLLLGPGHGVLDCLLDLGLTDDDEACVARIDEITEFLDAGS